MRIAYRVIASAMLLVQPVDAVGEVAGHDWPCWRGPERNGISRETDWSWEWGSEGPKVRWRAAVGNGFSSFAVVDDRVYTLGNRENTDTVFCFDANTGDIL